MGSGTGVARGAVAGLLVVAVVVAAVVVLSLLVARRRRPYGAISHGVVEVSLPPSPPPPRQDWEAGG